MGVADLLELVDAAMENSDATLSTLVGGHTELTNLRLWRGQVLVDWEPDASAGGCLLRPELLRRLISLQASVTSSATGLILTAPGRILAALSAQHADLVRRLGGGRRVELRIALSFRDGQYLGGEETYSVRESGRRATVVRLEAQVRSRNVATKVACGDVMGPSSRL